MKILSVDDSKAVHAFLDHCLEGLPVEVTHVYDGSEAIELYKSPCEFSMIFLDWEMPNVTGPEVVKTLRAKGVDVPIVMLTTKNKAEDIRMLLELGATDYMMKPFTPELIKEKIEMILGGSNWEQKKKTA